MITLNAIISILQPNSTYHNAWYNMMLKYALSSNGRVRKEDMLLIFNDRLIVLDVTFFLSGN